MGTSDPAALRMSETRRALEATLATIADDAARARENSEIIRQELRPDTIPTEPAPEPDPA